MVTKMKKTLRVRWNKEVPRKLVTLEKHLGALGASYT